MQRVGALSLLVALRGARGDGAKQLTAENFDEHVFKSGKFTFVKFFAPWWGHCKSLKPDWDRLGNYFNDNQNHSALIADVDCTEDSGKPLCEKYGVEGYPTLKYFSSQTDELGEKYEDARDYNKLKKFVRSKSKPPCDLGTLENCGKKDKAFIEELQAWDDAKAAEEQKKYQEELDAAKKAHQEEADLFEKQKDEAMATMKRMEEAKTELTKKTKALKYKLNILEQHEHAEKPKPKEEL